MPSQEDAGYTLKHWLPLLLRVEAKITERGLDVQFIFHAGETLSHGR